MGWTITSNWNVFDAGANDVAFCDGNNVCDAVARVDDDAGQRSLAHRATRPTGSQRKNGLNGLISLSFN